MQVVAGSNPVYGLNTLGGSMSMQTKSGQNFKQKNILMQPVKYFTSDLDKNLFQNKKVEEDLQKCILTTEILEEHNKAYYFYLYQSKCGAVYDFRIFRNFYKNKKI